MTQPTKPVDLDIRTVVEPWGAYSTVEQTGQLTESIDWTADAITDDHGYIQIAATVHDEAGLDDLIAKLELLRGAVRQVHQVCGF